MAKVALVLHIPDTTAEELKQIVKDVDELDCPGHSIAMESIMGLDVLALILSGQYNPDFKVLLDKIEDCLSRPCGDV